MGCCQPPPLPDISCDDPLKIIIKHIWDKISASTSNLNYLEPSLNLFKNMLDEVNNNKISSEPLIKAIEIFAEKLPKLLEESDETNFLTEFIPVEYEFIKKTHVKFPSNKKEALRSKIDIIIQLLGDKILVSRANLKYLEPSLKLFNIMLEKVTRKKIASKPLTTAVNNFLSKVLGLLQEPFDASIFLTEVKIVQLQYNKKMLVEFPKEIIDIQNKIKEFEEITTELGSDVDYFYFNESAKFWLKNFKEINNQVKNEVEGSLFYNKFDESFKDFFDREIDYLPNEKSPYKKDILQNIKILMRTYLETENDLKVTKKGWNEFFLKKMADFDLKWEFILEASAHVPNIMVENKLQLTYFYDGTLMDFPAKSIVSDEGIYREYDKKQITKEQSREMINFGRHETNEIRFQDAKISSYHFRISSKKVLKGNQIRNEYYVHNISRTFTYFVVDERGMALNKNNVVSIFKIRNFYVKDLYPKYNPDSNKYLSIQPDFLAIKKSKKEEEEKNKNPFIEIEFIEDRKSNRFEVSNPSENYLATIGIAEDDTWVIDDPDQALYEHHCGLKYDSVNRCWIIVDETTKQEQELEYKTLIRCFNYGQYPEQPNESHYANFVMKGVKLVNGQTIGFSGNAIKVEEFE